MGDAGTEKQIRSIKGLEPLLTTTRGGQRVVRARWSLSEANINGFLTKRYLSAKVGNLFLPGLDQSLASLLGQLLGHDAKLIKNFHNIKCL
jgi:hypothetical protein